MAVSLAHGLEPPPLLRRLADGELHSGEALAAELKQTRAAIWKGIERLRAAGIVVEAVARRGYRLPQAVELLEYDRIVAELSAPSLARLRRLDLVFEIDSTNTALLAVPAPPPGWAEVCLAELQHAGRGRRGRRWVAPFGASLALSTAWTFSDAARALPALSLGVGVAVARALGRFGATEVRVKWPNDIWYQDHKIGGVLIEMRAEALGPAHVVIGTGLNVRLPTAARAELRRQGTRARGAQEACAAPLSRNRLAGAILDELLRMLAHFEAAGFAAVRDEWLALDALRGRRVRITQGAAVPLEGIARGVDADGALVLECADGLQRFVSGEASLSLHEDGQ